MTLSKLKTLIQAYQKQTKSRTKILAFTTLVTLQFSYIAIDDYENIYSVNSLYMIIGKAVGHNKENNGNKYLAFDSADENKEVLKNIKNSVMGLKIKLRSQMMVSVNMVNILF